MQNFLLRLKLRTQLILVMLAMLVLFAGSFTYLQQVAEEKVLGLIQGEINGLMKAIEISIEEFHAAGASDDSRIKNIIQHLQEQGVREISILGSQQNVMQSSDPKLVGSRLSVSQNEYLIQETIGDHQGETAKKLYSAFVPIISSGTLEGYIHLSMYFEDLEKLNREMLFERMVWAIPVIGIGLICCVLIAYRFTKPIPVLIEAVQSIAEGKAPRLPAVWHHEIGGLCDSLDTLSRMLRDQKALEEKLKQAEHQAALAQLASGIAHEIRNPLNFIGLSVDHLSSTRSLEAGDRDLVRKIREQIGQVNQMVTNFLDLGRELVIRPVLMRVDLPLEEVLGLNAAAIKRRRIVLQRQYADPVPVLPLDVDRIKSCFQNLLDNALDAMADDGCLKVAIEATGSGAEIVFEDDGEGIAPENLAKVCEPYFTTKRKGIGLGLAIAKRIVEFHQGALSILNRPGAGTRVGVFLPCTPRRS